MNLEENKKTWRSTLFEAILFGVIFGLTNVISYGYIVVAARKLPAVEYGTFSALMGLVALGGVFANSIQAGATQAVKASVDTLKLRYVLGSAWKYALLGAALLIAILLPFKKNLNANTVQILLGGLCLFAMTISSAVIGYLAGIGKVRAQADLACYGAIARLAFGWLLLMAGFGISGALGGYVINYLIVFILAVLACRHSSASGPSNVGQSQKTKNIEIETPTLLAFILTNATFTLDQFVIQYFNPAVGGDYAATATIAKLIFFTSYPIIAIAYPRMLTQTNRAAQTKTLSVAAAAIAASGMSLVIVLHIFPHEIKNLFFGAQFEAAATSSAILALGILFFSMSVLAMHAKIAWKYSVGYLPAIAVLGGGLLLHACRHQTIGQIVENQTLIFGVQMLASWASLIYIFRAGPVGKQQATSQ